jgi:hypothetical protein
MDSLLDRSCAHHSGRACADWLCRGVRCDRKHARLSSRRRLGASVHHQRKRLWPASLCHWGNGLVNACYSPGRPVCVRPLVNRSHRPSGKLAKTIRCRVRVGKDRRPETAFTLLRSPRRPMARQAANNQQCETALTVIIAAESSMVGDRGYSLPAANRPSLSNCSSCRNYMPSRYSSGNSCRSSYTRADLPQTQSRKPSLQESKRESWCTFSCRFNLQQPAKLREQKKNAATSYREKPDAVGPTLLCGFTAARTPLCRLQSWLPLLHHA